MRLLVTGAAGQVGWELARVLAPLGETAALDRRQCDLCRPEMLSGIISELKPDIIVNAGAYTAVDRAEEEEQLATLVNATAVGALAEAAYQTRALLVHYSTDYVFDGTQDRPYREEDAPNPINAYGRSKLAGENAIRGSGCEHLILRTSWVFAGRGQNFLRTVLRLASEREELSIVADQVGAPNWARHIADATARVVRQAATERAMGHFASNTFHLAASGETSWYGFATAIMELAAREGLLARDKVPRIHAIATNEYSRAAARPRNSRLACERLRDRFGFVLPEWEQGLALCLQDMGSRNVVLAAG